MAGELADDIRSAMEEASSNADTTDASSGQDTPSPDAGESAPESSASGQATSTARDTSGRFAPRTPATDGKSVSETGQPSEEEQVNGDLQAAQDTAAQAPAPAVASKAPVSWKPEAREEWAKAPPAVQAEVQRREREITETLRTTAEARHFHQEFQQVVQPYMQFIQAERSTPIQAFQNLLNTAAELRTGSAQSKANLVADVIMQHGIDIETLDAVLSAKTQGRPVPQGQNNPAPMRDPRLDPVLDFVSTLQQRQQAQEQQVLSALQEETESFLNDPAMEFAWDVKDDMADILDLAAKRGQKISLQDAYNRATMLHPTISDIIQRRKVEQGAASHSEAAQRAKRAAASISDNGAPGRASEEGDSDDLRSVIATSIRTANRR